MLLSYIMFTFLVLNDFNDINRANVLHFSLDKGHFVAKSLCNLGHKVYFMTDAYNYEKDGLIYISMEKITDTFVSKMDYIMIVREPLFLEIIEKLPAIQKMISIEKTSRTKPKFIVKSDNPLWSNNKEFVNGMKKFFEINNRRDAKKWVIEHVDHICCQNQDYCDLAIYQGIPRSSLLISNMGIENKRIDYNQLTNPYDINHSYCVADISMLEREKALLPLYYVEHPEKISEANTKKHIIVYTGRIKIDGGKILYNMVNIMKILGDQYELHIFPGSFYYPIPEGNTTRYSGKNANHLKMLRDGIFASSKNIIIHYPYIHGQQYAYFHYASCGIDFSQCRPKNVKSFNGHAKILEYCETGLPVVCEERINNLFLVENGKNAIVLPYMASDEAYAEAIKKIINMPIDREYCQKITLQNENWDVVIRKLLRQLDN